MASKTLSNGHTEANGVKGKANHKVPRRLYSQSQPPSLSAFEELCSQSTDRDTYPQAATVVSNIPIYELRQDDLNADHLSQLQDEWHHILLSGPGVLVLRNFMSDTNLIHQVNHTLMTLSAKSQPAQTQKATTLPLQATTPGYGTPSKSTPSTIPRA